MFLHERSAWWGSTHRAGPHRAGPKLLLAAGVVSVLAAIAVLASSLAPMFVSADTLTVGPSLLGTLAGIRVGGGDDPKSGLPVGGLAHAVVTDGPVNGVAFTMSVPALGYSATVLEGVGTPQLDRGPGHYPDSAWPGQVGNVAVAAHNVYWLSFARLRTGDRVQLRTQHGVFTYEITGSKVVGPNDRSVLAQTSDQRLTLTTCYPLWAGAFATQRLVFFAREI